MERVFHTFAPVYDGASRILILGTLPSPKSREQGFYYGHPQNRFWPVLAALFHREIPADAAGKKLFLLEKKIALWDMVSSCRIQGADDGSIRDEELQDLTPILAGADIRAIFANGKKAAALYEKNRPKGALPFFSLPSTSPANCRCSLRELTEAYAAVLPYLEEGDTGTGPFFK